MLNIKKVEFKDIDTAKKNIDLNSVHYKYKEIPAKLFKSKKNLRRKIYGLLAY